MHNPYRAKPYLAAGCDVSADWIDLACGLGSQLLDGAKATHCRFANTAAGHHQMVSYLGKSGTAVRVVVEASGIYSLDLALTLHEAEGVELMLVNPRAAKDYRRAQMHRSKTDELDAVVLCDYALRMPFVAWQPPEEAALELRQLARRIADLTLERAREKNRLHAAEVSRTRSAVVVNDIEVNLRHLARRIDELVRQALRAIQRSARLASACKRLTSVRGIAAKSAVLLLGELMTLPQGMAVREWVSYAGLDVRQHRSGRTVEERPRISKEGNVHIRRALYMPALVAVQREPHVGAFYEQLVERGKPKMVAVVAVMRKLLHAIYGMLKHDADFDGSRFYQIPTVAA